MPQLEDIPTLPADAIELLEAVGYLDAHDLSEADPSELADELKKANKALAIMATAPDVDTVEEWKKLAAGYEPAEPEVEELEDDLEGNEALIDSTEEDSESGEDDDAHDIPIDPSFVNFEDDPEVQEMLSISPEAAPLDATLIRRHKLAVGDIPEGILLTQCEGEVEMNVMTSSRLAKTQRREAEIKRTGLVASRIRSFDDAASNEHHVKPLDKGESKESVSVSKGLNAGLLPESRRFVRGVLHPDPTSVRVSAFFAILVEVMLIASLIGIPWVLIHEHLSGNSMLWWVVGIASGLVLSALCYLFWGLGARCRVCGQRQFAPKKCLKNKKAHHIPVIGYIFPTALHAIFFKWFYCTYCGTAVRLKK